MTKIKKIVAGMTAFACLVGACVGVVAVMDKPVGNQSVDKYAGLVAEQTESDGMALVMGETLNADGTTVADSVTVTATLTANQENYNDTIYWHMGFQTENEWTTGKSVNDYVTMTVAEDTHSVTLDCKAAFGTPIVVTAISADNTELNAACQLDYVKRITGMSDFYINTEPTYGTSYKNYVRLGMSNSVTAIVEYGVGTISPKIDITSMTIALPSALQSMIQSKITSGAMTAKSAINPSVTCDPTQTIAIEGTFSVNVNSFYAGGGDERTLNNFLYDNAFDASTGVGASYMYGTVSVNMIVTYGETEYQVYSYTHIAENIGFEKGALTNASMVTSVDLNQSNIYF